MTNKTPINDESAGLLECAALAEKILLDKKVHDRRLKASLFTILPGSSFTLVACFIFFLEPSLGRQEAGVLLFIMISGVCLLLAGITGLLYLWAQHLFLTRIVGLAQDFKGKSEV